MRIDDPAERLFGSVAIREGYEVGERGGQSLHRIGCVLQLTEVQSHDDGTFDIVAVGRGRLRLEALQTTGEFLAGEVALLDDPDDAPDPANETISELARTTFDNYRDVLSSIRGEQVLTGDLPHDPAYLSWSLAGTCLLTLRDRQLLLEAEPTTLRLAMLIDLMREEIAAMTVLPSLPATEVARTGWSPN